MVFEITGSAVEVLERPPIGAPEEESTNEKEPIKKTVQTFEKGALEAIEERVVEKKRTTQAVSLLLWESGIWGTIENLGKEKHAEVLQKEGGEYVEHANKKANDAEDSLIKKMKARAFEVLQSGGTLNEARTAALREWL